MTKKQMLEKLQEEFNNNYNVYLMFKDLGYTETADKWWRAANQTEIIIHMLFGDDINVFDNYLHSK